MIMIKFVPLYFFKRYLMKKKARENNKKIMNIKHKRIKRSAQIDKRTVRSKSNEGKALSSI